MEPSPRKVILYIRWENCCSILSYSLLVLILTGSFAEASVPLAPDWEKISGKTLPDVVFTDASEREIHLSDFKGKVLILHPMFTHCPGTCSLVASQLAAAISGLSGAQWKDLRIVSFSFDPEETPEALTKFEKLLHADASFWKVVRAKPAAIGQMLDALDFRTLQLSRSNYEHANLVFIMSGDRILRDYVYGSELTAERLSRSLRLATANKSNLLASKSYLLFFCADRPVGFNFCCCK